jgi:hypothetical protein
MYRCWWCRADVADWRDPAAKGLLGEGTSAVAACSQYRHVRAGLPTGCHGTSTLLPTSLASSSAVFLLFIFFFHFFFAFCYRFQLISVKKTTNMKRMLPNNPFSEVVAPSFIYHSLIGIDRESSLLLLFF